MESPPPQPIPSEESDPEFKPPPSRWPVTFGVIAIVFGILGFLSAAWTILGLVFMSDLDLLAAGTGTPESAEADAMIAAVTQSWERWATLSISLNAVLVLLAGLLLVAGIFLIQRKPIARPLLISWAYAKIVFGIGALIVQFQIQRDQTSAIFASANETIQSTASTTGAAPPTMVEMDGIFSALMGLFFFIGVLWIVALPVVLLIWLYRDLVKADIETWRPCSPNHSV